VDHTPVMVDSVFRYLITDPHGFYIDGTTGLGGHIEYLLKRSGGELQILGIDIDPKILEVASSRLKKFGDRVELRVGNFKNIDKFCKGRRVSGVLLDLGLSAFHIFDKERGFSYMHDGNLDMKMGVEGRSVSEFVASADRREIDRVIAEFGEERRHRSIAREIVRMRRSMAFSRTSQLRKAVARVVPERDLLGALARTFQAFRIWANNELENLRIFLPRAVDVLVPGGRMVVISYHSLEDRIVKHFFKQEEKGCICPPDLPRCVCGRVPTLKILTRKPVRPSKNELKENVRSRSAKLRAVVRIEEGN
jgi:16S rRNA (cytosine1402-N4)-methyltransferase